jgi:hypothetical protein
MGDSREFLKQSQRTFYAIDLRVQPDARTMARDAGLVQLGLEHAEQHGTLQLVGSVWSPDEQSFYDGIERRGVRVVTFAHVLKSDAFPLALLLQRLLALGRAGMNCPVEIEFAVDVCSGVPEFAVLQIRPCGGRDGGERVELGHLSRGELLCYSPHALGNGLVHGLGDVVYVKPGRFDAAHTLAMADEIGRVNEELMGGNRPYMLIGPGRWGTTQSRLGIPVHWSQISGARIIVETTLEDFVVEPSQGSHFFQNLTAFGIAYLAVNAYSGEGFIDWAWLDAQPTQSETTHIRHVRLKHALEARIDGEASAAAVLKRSRRATDI